MRLRRIDKGMYETQDGRFELAYDYTILEGDCQCAICLAGALGCRHDGNGIDDGWYVWDRHKDDYAFDSGPLAFDTLTEARGYLLVQLSKEK